MFRSSPISQKSFILLLFAVVSLATPVKAQKNNQLWMEYMLNYPFANSFNLESAFTYSTVLNQPKWRALDYNATIEYSLSPHVDLLGSALVSYTAQTETYNTLEIRPMLGTRLFLTPNNRIQARLLLRLEERNFKNIETNEWQSVMRPRARAECIIPISQDSYFKDNLWYAVMDAEWLFVTTDVQERYANRFRFRVGVGYRLNYSFRFEVLYMNQESRNGIDEAFSSTDNVIRIRLKHFLRKTKPSKAAELGN